MPDRRAPATAVARSRFPVFVPLLAAGLALAVAACAGGRPSGFQRAAESTAAGLAAARATIELVHSGRLTIPYGRAAFVEYRASLEPAPDELRDADGAPPNAPALAATVGRARAVLDHPCLEGACDWEAQLGLLDEARAGLLPFVPS